LEPAAIVVAQGSRGPDPDCRRRRYSETDFAE
jgi:hypothetical protein